MLVHVLRFPVFDEERNNAALTLLLAPGGAAMRGMYAPDMALLHLRLRQLDRLLFVHAHALHVHLEQAAASILIFTSPWLLSMFASEVRSASKGASGLRRVCRFAGRDASRWDSSPHSTPGAERAVRRFNRAGSRMDGVIRRTAIDL